MSTGATSSESTFAFTDEQTHERRNQVLTPASQRLDSTLVPALYSQQACTSFETQSRF